ncbi:alpha/beta fold hydrolase [Hylemonella gracilis]|uniref:Alpha/beta fold hydrolase n=1 Tax=Hylemonella gracilis TaxID=80880 RepID=A0A4P6UJP5_9BURK|nr:alpha/beta fold hydrolase [Hylemonella gracilis]QBK03571.1 alpha/beta fold hydrolase [Hylemonella gracilis]
MKRFDLTFPSGTGHCAAWLHQPDGPGPHPCVVVAHGIGAIRQVRLSAYARRFTDAGVALLTFDYRHWGESSGHPRFLCAIGKQHQDIRCAIDAAQAHPDIDPARVFLFGTSFGGGHALAVGAQRPDLAGVISQCTVSDCLVVAAKSPLRQILRWIWAGTLDQTKALLGLQPHYIKLAGEPGEAALMTKLNAEQRYRDMLDGPSRWENKIAARLMLWLPLYRPIRSAPKIKAPLLMIVCDKDEICPATIARRAADIAPRGRAVHFDSSHFDIYFGELFESATATMLGFVQDPR